MWSGTILLSPVSTMEEGWRFLGGLAYLGISVSVWSWRQFLHRWGGMLLRVLFLWQLALGRRGLLCLPLYSIWTALYGLGS